MRKAEFGMRKVKVNTESGIRNITIRVLVFSAASFRTRPRPRESEFFRGLGSRDEDEYDDEGGSCRAP